VNKNAAATAALAVLLTCLVSCATHPRAYREIDAGVNRGDFQTAFSTIEKPETIRNVYSSRNEILFFLDRGMIGHYAGLWEASSENL